MDFDDFDTRAASSEGAKMHVKQPVTGEPILNEGLPCMVHIRGVESSEAVDEVQAIVRAQAKRSKDDPRDHHDDLLEMAMPLVLGFENMQRRDPKTGKSRDLTPSKDDVAWFLNLQRAKNGRSDQVSFVEQVVKFSSDRANYLGNVSGGS